MIIITFTGPVNNDSLQIGDIAYFIFDPTTTNINGFDQSTDSPTLIGPITAIEGNTITVDEQFGTMPGVNDFIMFKKDSGINLSGLVGYYAEVNIKNNSTKKAEMFSIASGITPSSK
tara:strand:+ start:758 stop:1108 length:351 start_codon:yes stop_codon:yes gene_type:complete